MGGYQIIDFLNTPFVTATPSTITGVYAKIEGTKKPIMISNLVIGGTEYHDTFIDLTVSGTDYTGEIYGYTITITDTDSITITEKE